MPVFNAARVGATVTEKTLIRSNTTQLDVENTGPQFTGSSGQYHGKG